MTSGHTTNDNKHAAGQRERLLLANEKVSRENEALIFALREVHSILSSKTNGLTDEQRVSCAKSHVILALGKHGTVPAAVPRTTN